MLGVLKEKAVLEIFICCCYVWKLICTQPSFHVFCGVSQKQASVCGWFRVLPSAAVTVIYN